MTSPILDSYVIIDADDDFYNITSAPMPETADDDTIDIIVNALSDIENHMPTTPANTPTAIIYDDATYASILMENGLKSSNSSPAPSVLQGLSAITSYSSMSIITSADELIHALKQLEVIEEPQSPSPPTSNEVTTSHVPYDVSLTPMILHGGIPIWYMIGARFGLIPKPM